MWYLVECLSYATFLCGGLFWKVKTTRNVNALELFSGQFGTKGLGVKKEEEIYFQQNGGGSFGE